MEASVNLLSPVERVFYLKTVAALGDLSPTELAPMAQRTRERFFKKGTTVLNAGQHLGGFHVIVDGQIEIRDAAAKRTIVGSEETLGLTILLSRREQPFDAVALEDTSTLEINGDDLYDVFEDNFTLVHEQIRRIAGEMLEERLLIADGTYLAPREGLIDDTSRELDLIQRLLLMTRGAFRNANMNALVDLAEQASERRCEAGETLWRSGEASGFTFNIVDGTIRATIPGAGRSFRAGPGYPLGNLESMARKPRWYDAVTETPVVLLRVETDHFFDVLEDHFAMAIEFIAMMTTGLLAIRAESKQTGASREPGPPASGHPE